MRRFILRRLAQNLLLLAFVIVAVFVMMRLTSGDPARIKAPVFASPDVLDRYRAEFGTDKPIYVQLGTFLKGLSHGDFGDSFRYQQSVFTLIWERLPRTILLAGTSLVISIAVALWLGVAGARKPGGWMDRLGLVVAAIGQSAPIFWVGLLLVLVFSVKLGWFPAVGFTGPKSLVLPAIAVSLSIIPADLRVVTEVVFNYPGIGQLAISSVNARDYPTVQAITIISASIFIFVNLVIDMVYMLLDPRIRIEA